MITNLKINSGLEGRLDRNGNPLKLINGFLPFQWEGVEFIAEQEKAAYMRWDTGTGKTVAAEATILMKRYEGYELTIYVVRPNHLIGAQRKLKLHTGLDAHILDGTPAKRSKIFTMVNDLVLNETQPILLCNPEKFSADKENFKQLVEGRRVLLILDEAAVRFGNRATKLYKNACEVFYTSAIQTQNGRGKTFYPREDFERPAQLFTVALSATPITRDPENLFNTIRFMVPGHLGSVTDFNNRYVAWKDRWGNVQQWRDLDDLAARVAPLVHQASKDDPEIAAQFPEQMPPEIIFCELDKASKFLYDTLHHEYEHMGRGSAVDFEEILAAIHVLQQIASNPRAVLHSAKIREEYEIEAEALQDWMDEQGISGRERNAIQKMFDDKFKEGNAVALKLRDLIGDDTKFTDRDKNGNCSVSKMLELRDQLDTHDGKAIIFTTEKVMQDLVGEWLDEWQISHVKYHGGISSNQIRQATIDAFRFTDIKVFLSTDAGQDSIDLPEASLTIHYDWPWAWSGVKQRENRQHRIDSTQSVVRVVTLACPGTVEDRKAEVVAKKKGYHDQIFGGAEADDTDSVTKTDWLYVLTGNAEPEEV